jgi:hypothetical protein
MADTIQASITRINTLIDATFGTNGGNPITTNQLLQIAALFDTLHDFGKYSTCYDTLSGGRGETITANYKILRMRFSALSKMVFGIGSDRLSRGYGSLRTPAQVYTSALTAKTLEADFLEYAKQYRTNSGTFISSNRGIDYGSIMTKLKDNGYGTSGKVCLLVDTQKMLYKWSGFTNNCIVAILRESVYDAAGKLLISDTTGKNVHVETDRYIIIDDIKNKVPNMYTYIEDFNSNDFVGNIQVALGPIPDINNYNITARIGATPILVQGNSGAKHPNSILMLNKNIDGAANATCATTVGTLINPNSTSVTKPYNGYVDSDKNNVGAGGCPSFANNNANFTQKRTGDGNQACICKRINMGKIVIKATNKNDESINITKIVLVTIDRMLYAIALLLNIPVIYEHPTEGAAYIPNVGTDLGMGGGNSGMNDINDIQPNQLNIPETPIIYQRGGDELTLDKNDSISDDEAKYILENPVYMLALAPFIYKIAYINTGSIFKTAIESILAMNYTTFMNESPVPPVRITNPQYTTYLRNVITVGPSTPTDMNTLIGEPIIDRDITANLGNLAKNTALKIIHLEAPIIGDETARYILIYKYKELGDTYTDENTGRNLYIVKKSFDGTRYITQSIAKIATHDEFGKYKIKKLFNSGISITSESSEKIEEMLGELLAAKLVEGGLSLRGEINFWGPRLLALGTEVGTAVGTAVGYGVNYFFNRDDSSNPSDIMEGGKVTSLSDKSEYNSSLDSKSINSFVGDNSLDSSLSEVDSKGKSTEQSSEQSAEQSAEQSPEQSPEQSSDIDTIYDDSTRITTKSDSIASDSETNPENYPLLTKNNNYYAVAFNYTQTHKIIREHGVNLPFYNDLCNVFTMFSYLWLFNKYIVNVCIDDEETAIAYDEWSVKGDPRTVLIPTHKSFNKTVDTINRTGTLPFLLTDLEQVLFDEKDYMYFQLQQIKRYVLRDDFIEVIEENVDKQTVSEAKVDKPTVSEATVDEPPVSEATVDEPPVSEAKVDEPTVSEATVDEPTVSEAKVDEPSVDKEKVDEPPVGK